MPRLLLSLMVVSTVAAAGKGCSVRDFGAVPDNRTDNSAAFRKAAKVCAGGELLVPPG